MTLGEKLQILRQKQGMSQKELAEKTNKSTADIALWESNEAVPSIADIARLSAVLCVTTDSLIVDSEVIESQDEKTAYDSVAEVGTASNSPKTVKSKKKLAFFIPLCAIAVVFLLVF